MNTGIMHPWAPPEESIAEEAPDDQKEWRAVNIRTGGHRASPSRIINNLKLYTIVWTMPQNAKSRLWETYRTTKLVSSTAVAARKQDGEGNPIFKRRAQRMCQSQIKEPHMDSASNK